jgi:hypothetical protein
MTPKVLLVAVGGITSPTWETPLGARDPSGCEGEDHMELVLWLIAVALVITGVVTLFRGQVAFGVVLIIVGLLVGPGGVSVFA